MKWDIRRKRKWGLQQEDAAQRLSRVCAQGVTSFVPNKEKILNRTRYEIEMPRKYRKKKRIMALFFLFDSCK